MSTISAILPKVADNFSTQIADSTVSSTALSITLDSVAGLPTEGVGQLFKKNTDGDIITGSIEFIHWTSISGNALILTDTDDRGLTGSDSGAQSYVADDYFEVWVSTYYQLDTDDVVAKTNGSLTTPKITTSINDSNGNEIIKTPATASAVNEFTFTNAATGGAPVISATGDDTNINLDLKGKGTGTVRKPTSVSIQVFDGATVVATGDGKFYFTIPEELNGMNLVGVHARVVTAGTTGTTDIQIANVTDSVDMLSTKLTIDSTETGSDTAATAAVIDTTKDDVVTNDLLRIDVDAKSTTAPKGLIVRLRFALP